MESSAFVFTRGAGHNIEYLVELCPALTVSGQIATFIVDEEEHKLVQEVVDERKR